MKTKLLLLLMGLATGIFMACNNASTNESTSAESTETTDTPTENQPAASSAKKSFDVKSGYAEFKMSMDITRKLWWDDFGALQYEESFMDLGSMTVVSKSIIRDGFKYDFKDDSNEGSRFKYFAPASTDYSKVSKEDIDRYGIKLHGNENILGRSCEVVSMQKPMESKVWMWKNIPMKTWSKMGMGEIVSEAVVLREEAVPADKFKLPEGITFKEF